VKALFRNDNIIPVWGNNILHYTINLLAGSSGMRMGEVQALQIQYIHKEYIGVFHSWSRKYGLKSAKWGSEREINSETSQFGYTEKPYEGLGIMGGIGYEFARHWSVV